MIAFDKMQDFASTCPSAKQTLTQHICDFNGSLEAAQAIVRQVINDFAELVKDEEVLSIVKSLPEILGNIAQQRVVRADEYYCDILRLAYESAAVGLINQLCVTGHASLVVKVAYEQLPFKDILANVTPKNPVVLQLFIQQNPASSEYLRAFNLPDFLPYLVFKLRSPSLVSVLVKECRSFNCVDQLIKCILQEWHSSRWIERAEDASEKFLTLLLYETLSSNLTPESLRVLMQGVSARLNSPRPITHRSGKLIASKLAEVQGKPEFSMGYTMEEYVTPDLVKPIEERVEEDSDDSSEDEPCHYEDLLMSLSSEHKGRFEGGVSSAAKLISKDLPELDLLFERLSTAVLRTLDKFVTPNFEALKINALTELAVARPECALELWRPRLMSSETSLAEKDNILDALDACARRLNCYEVSDDAPTALKIPSKGVTKLKHKHRPKSVKPQVNKFLPHAAVLIKGLRDLDPHRLEPFLLTKVLKTQSTFLELLVPPSTTEVRNAVVSSIESLILGSLDRNESKVVESALLTLTLSLKLLLGLASEPGEALPIIATHYPSLAQVFEETNEKLAKWKEEFPETVATLGTILKYWASDV